MRHFFPWLAVLTLVLGLANLFGFIPDRVEAQPTPAEIARQELRDCQRRSSAMVAEYKDKGWQLPANFDDCTRLTR